MDLQKISQREPLCLDRQLDWRTHGGDIAEDLDDDTIGGLAALGERRLRLDQSAWPGVESLDLGGGDPVDRRALLDALGEAFSRYRDRAYATGPGEAEWVGIDAVRDFISAVRPFLDQSVRLAHRSDGLFEAYWLMRLEPGVARVESLYCMLEGQVAALTQGDLSPDEVVSLVDPLFRSPLYRADQHSFLLYPNRDLPPFWDKNVVPEELLTPATAALLERETGIIYRDVEGRVRFGASLYSGQVLEQALDGLQLDGCARAEVLDLFESVFHHAAFTGRSGTMYRYEGLGSIYWHMVSKLLLAVQEHVHKGLFAMKCGVL